MGHFNLPAVVQPDQPAVDEIVNNKEAVHPLHVIPVSYSLAEPVYLVAGNSEKEVAQAVSSISKTTLLKSTTSKSVKAPTLKRSIRVEKGESEEVEFKIPKQRKRKPHLMSSEFSDMVDRERDAHAINEEMNQSIEDAINTALSNTDEDVDDVHGLTF